eukprot:TRINITY_DN163_c0_g1_i1.p1 TRINITY_DN163_c0_g1~~TRINITY_DN163_c0_g1_i1.p1  ORF type:complete len:476 (+),score=135.63 TRINITY_DN163_c0_g1_i1:240-1667(+)
MTEDEAIYADCPEDDIYEDLEVELKKAGYNTEHLNRIQTGQAPSLPTRNMTTAVPPPAQPSKEAVQKKGKKDKPLTGSLKRKPAQKPPVSGAKPQRSSTAQVIPADMLNQRRLLKKVERMEPNREETSNDAQIDFRSQLKKTPRKPPPVLKPKPSLSSVSTDPSKIRYKRVALSRVDLTNPPIIDRDKKPRITLDVQYDDDGLYDDVVQVMGQDTYDDVELAVRVNGQEPDQDVYDDVENVIDPRQDDQQLYDDVENQNPDMDPGDYYDDVENLKRPESPGLYDDVDNLKRPESPGLYDDVENVGIRRPSSPNDTYDDVCLAPGVIGGQGEEVYDEVPDMNLSEPQKKQLTPAQEKKRKAEELKFRKKQMETAKKRQKEFEKTSKELEKKRKVFMEYYNIRESDKPIMVAQVASLNDLKGKQNLSVDIGDIIHVLCKEHKKMPKGAWLAEKSDKSAIGFLTPAILNQNILPAFDD